MIWAGKGGADTPENLLTLCEKCHGKVHNEPKKDEETLIASLKNGSLHSPRRRLRRICMQVHPKTFRTLVYHNFPIGGLAKRD